LFFTLYFNSRGRADSQTADNTVATDFSIAITFMSSHNCMKENDQSTIYPIQKDGYYI